jgi:hypothetical protein
MSMTLGMVLDDSQLDSNGVMMITSALLGGDEGWSIHMHILSRDAVIVSEDKSCLITSTV